MAFWEPFYLMIEPFIKPEEFKGRNNPV